MELREKDTEYECIENFLYDFPDQDTPGISGILASRDELRRLKLKPKETAPLASRGKFFNHQLIVQRILRMFPSQFLIHEMGTGKTCAIIGFTELISSFIINKDVQTNFKHVYIITGKAVKREIKEQIVCKCSQPGKYDTDKINMMEDETAQKSQITTAIKSWYSLYSYDKFIKDILKKLGYEDLFSTRKITPAIIKEIAKELSDCIIWIDEVHEMIVKNNKSKDKKEGKDKKYRYEIFHKVFHKMERSKLILSSATPMINKPSEFGPLINLMLPMDRQIPDNYDWDKATVEELEPYLQGRISFVRSLQNEDIELIEMGEYTESLCESKYPLKLFISHMGDFQSKAYEKAVKIDNTTREAERNAALFVFPDGKWGSGTTKSEKEKMKEDRRLRKLRKQEKLGQEKVIKTATSGALATEIVAGTPEEDDDDIKSSHKYFKLVDKHSDLYKPTKAFKDAIKTLDDVKKYSAIFYNIIRIEQSNPGCGYVFMNYVEGGVIPLTMCLEALGWERFYEGKSIFETIEGSPTSFCKEGQSETKQLKQKFATVKKKRYAMLTGGESRESVIKASLEAWNSYENRNGDIIKLFIVTPTGKQGISLNHVLRIHNDPMWSWSEIIQSIARALRVTSHKYLEGHHFIQLYRHVAVSKSGESIGCFMYHRAIAKDIKIGRVMRILKILASDCNLNKKRNVLITDVPGSEQCNYQSECNYNCLYKPVDWIDYSASDNLYLQDIIDAILPTIQELYLIKNSYSYLDLYEILVRSNVTERQIDLVMAYIINKYIPIKDIYGYNCYMKEDNGIFFTVRGFPKNNINYYSNYYSRVLIGVHHNTDLDSIIEDINETKKDNVIDIDLEQLDKLKNQGKIFEKAYLEYLNNNEDKFSKAIIDHYKHMYEKVGNDVVHWINIRDDSFAVRSGRFDRIKMFNNFRILKNSTGKSGTAGAIIDKWQNGGTHSFDYYYSKDIYAVLDNDQLILIDKKNRIDGKNYESVNIRELYHILYRIGADLPPGVTLNYDINLDKKNLDFLKDKPEDEVIFFNTLSNYKEKDKRVYNIRTGKIYDYIKSVLEAKGLLLKL